MNPLVTEYIENAPPVQKKLMKQIRLLLHENLENLTEDFKWSRPIFKTSQNIAYFQSNKNHLNLGFYVDSHDLLDPDGIFEGTGKVLRHVKFKSEDDLNTELLKEWFQILNKL
jgi:hypothetical protein